MFALPSILFMLFFILIFAVLLVYFASLLGPRPKDSEVKREGYECGVLSESKSVTRVPIKFYLTAILFILFDIEIIFVYPWALVYMDFIREGEGIYIFSVMMIFLFIFMIGLFWEFKSQALDWEKEDIKKKN